MSGASPFAQSLADLSLNLYREISAANGASSNIFISPLSISFALAMTYAGANGNTKKQMRDLLLGNRTDKQDDELHALYADVLGQLNKGSGSYKLHLANRVFAHQPTLGDLRPQFTSVIKEKYTSDLQPLDFGDEAHARGVINNWVSEKTNQKIKDLIPRGVLSSLTRLVLVNAIYFKGDWKTKFDSKATRPRTFYAGPNKEIEIDMMHMGGQKFYYNENEGFQVLGMPYKGDELFMFVLLPQEREGLAALEKSLSGSKLLEAVLAANMEQKLDVS